MYQEHQPHTVLGETEDEGMKVLSDDQLRNAYKDTETIEQVGFNWIGLGTVAVAAGLAGMKASSGDFSFEVSFSVTFGGAIALKQGVLMAFGAMGKLHKIENSEEIRNQ